jgi:hypothetical protein
VRAAGDVRALQCADENSRRPIALPAIASSLDVSGGFHDNTAAAKATADVAAIVKRDGLPRGVFLNIDVPAWRIEEHQAHDPEPALWWREIDRAQGTRAGVAISGMISRNRRCSAARN